MEQRLVGKDEVKRIIGTSSDQTAYRVIRRLNDELRAQGMLTIRGRVSLPYLVHRYFGIREEEL